MSALPPKADMCGATKDVCFGPKADPRAASTIDQLVRSNAVGGIVGPSSLAVLEVDNDLKFCGLLDRKITRLRTLVAAKTTTLPAIPAECIQVGAMSSEAAMKGTA